MSAKLSPAEIADALTGLNGWQDAPADAAIEKTFKFKDFAGAWSFMSACALMAEKMDHHPDWANVYNRVDVKLTTHDAGGVTDKDIRLATYMNDLAV